MSANRTISPQKGKGRAQALYPKLPSSDNKIDSPLATYTTRDNDDLLTLQAQFQAL